MDTKTQNDLDFQRCSNCLSHCPSASIPLHEAYCFRNVRRCEQCGEIMHISEKEDHDLRMHRENPCPKCHAMVTGSDLTHHLEQVCAFRLKACLYCELELPVMDMWDHESACGSRTEECEKCQKRVLIRDLAMHTANNCGEFEPTPAPKPDTSDQDTGEGEDEDTKDNNNNDGLQCPYCYKRCGDFELLQIHVLTECPNRDLTSNEDMKMEDELKHEDKGVEDGEVEDVKLPCEICDEMVALSAFESHQNVCFQTQQSKRTQEPDPVMEQIRQRKEEEKQEQEPEMQDEKIVPIEATSSAVSTSASTNTSTAPAAASTTLVSAVRSCRSPVRIDRTRSEFVVGDTTTTADNTSDENEKEAIKMPTKMKTINRLHADIERSVTESVIGLGAKNDDQTMSIRQIQHVTRFFCDVTPQAMCSKVMKAIAAIRLNLNLGASSSSSSEYSTKASLKDGDIYVRVFGAVSFMIRIHSISGRDKAKDKGKEPEAEKEITRALVEFQRIQGEEAVFRALYSKILAILSENVH